MKLDQLGGGLCSWVNVSSSSKSGIGILEAAWLVAMSVRPVLWDDEQ